MLTVSVSWDPWYLGTLLKRPVSNREFLPVRPEYTPITGLVEVTEGRRYDIVVGLAGADWIPDDPFVSPGLRAGRRIGDRLQVLHPRRGLPARFPNNISVNGVPLRDATSLIVISPAFAADGDRRGSSEEAMRNVYSESEPVRVDNQLTDPTQDTEGLPNRLLTAREVAKYVGCHEETVRRAYWRGLLRSQRFGVRGRRFHPEDVLDWIRRGAPTKVP
jgi:excisionase family DNA binding protein